MICFSFVICTELTATIKGRLVVPYAAQVNVTRVTLNDGEYNTYTDLNGNFTFYRVVPGIHVLDVHDHYLSYSQVKIQLLEEDMGSPKCIEYVYFGAEKHVISHPLELTANAKFQYFEKRASLSWAFIFRNPMVMIMIMSVGMMYVMPKMMANMDDGQKEQMKKQMEMQKTMTTDPSKMISNLWGQLKGDSETGPPKVKSERTQRLKRE